MKRLAMIVCALALACLAGLTACGGGGDQYADSPYLGTWNADTASYMGLELSAADILEDQEFSITLEASGKATANVMGDTGEGEWAPTDSGFKLIDPDTGDLEFTVGEDGKAVLDAAMFDPSYEGMTISFALS